MNEVKVKAHLAIIISSLDKALKKVKITGKLNIKEIYLLNTIFRILNNLELTDDQTEELFGYYTDLIYYSDQICNPEILKTYQTTPLITFQQADPDDCNNFETNTNIYYWQENYSLVNNDIIDLIDNTSYLINKLYDTYESFELGKNIDYTNIGKLVFLALDSNTINYKVYDSLGNDVTHTFYITLIPELNATALISDNIYSHGIINFKIIKI